MTERLKILEYASLAATQDEFRKWLRDDDVRADILGPGSAYDGNEFKELTFAEDEFCQMLVRNYAPMTLQEIANVTGMTRERVRQIQEDALDKERQKRAMGLPSLLDELDDQRPASKPENRKSKDLARKRVKRT